MTHRSPSYRRRLKKLSIENFRGIDTLDLDFTGPDGNCLDLIVLAGANGTGKTSVLEAAIRLLGKEELLPQDSFQSPDADTRFGSKQYVVTGDLESVQEGTPYRAALRVEPGTDYGLYTHRVPPITPDFDKSGSAYVAEVEYFSANREPDSTREIRYPSSSLESPPRHRDVEAHRVVTLEAQMVSAYYRALRENRRQPNGPTDQSLPFFRLQRFWSEFDSTTEIDVIPFSSNPGSGDRAILRERGKTIPLDVTSLSMACELSSVRPDIPRIVTLDRHSSGQLSIFAFALPFIFRDRPVDIAFIDEPEQHLHIQWHRMILPALRTLSPTTQFIVATHSEEIVESALSYERFILVEESDPRARTISDESKKPEAEHE